MRSKKQNKRCKRMAVLCMSFIMLMVLTMGNVIYAATPEANLLNTYGNLFERVGASVEYSELCDSNVMKHLKAEYNSTTMGNDMKPNYILRAWSPQFISVAEAKKLGYYIPNNYTESTVPKLNFDQVDDLLKRCYENGIALRGHTLMWHAQTPDWFFRTGYSASGAYVSQAVMDARLEMFIKTYMNYVHTHQYGSVVYAWDVVNEYLHATESGWSKIYGNPTTQSELVKKCFQYAYDCISYFGLTDSVGLFYNDFNTYMIPDDVIKLINYVNSGKKICDGVGMQSHVGTNFPSVASYANTLKKFADAGFEIQITELDIASTSNEVQAKYVYDLLTAVINAKKAGANITSLTFWGLSDDRSWISDKNPLLYSTLGVAKPSYYSALKAYTDAGYAVGGGTGGGDNNNGNNGGNTGDTTNNNYVTLQEGWYYIKNTNAQKYLQVKDNTGANAQNVELGTGTGVQGQKWYLTNVGEGYVTLKNGTGYMLDVAYGADEDGANVQIYSANNMAAQMFKLVKTSGNNVYGVLTKGSTDTKALDAYNFGTADGTNICQWTYYANDCQKWVFEACNAPSTGGDSNNNNGNNDNGNDNNNNNNQTGKATMSIKVTADWGQGATAEITITNLTGKDLNGWTATFTTNREITASWGPNIVSSNGMTYTMTNPSWSSSLKNGESYTFGCAMGSGEGNVTITNGSLK